MNIKKQALSKKFLLFFSTNIICFCIILFYRYVNDFEIKIPREEINTVRDLLTREIESIDQKYHVTFCGSYRRGEPSSSDIDILITHPNYVSETYVEEHKQNTSIITPSHSSQNARHLLDKIINKLFDVNFLTDTLAHGDKKFMVNLNYI